MELFLSSDTMKWIDANKQDMSRPAFIRHIIHSHIVTAASERGQDEEREDNSNGSSKLCNGDQS